MPKKLPPPKSVITLHFTPTKLMIKHDAATWYLRARQSTAVGDSWIVIAAATEPDELIAIAKQLSQHEPAVFQAQHLDRRTTP